MNKESEVSDFDEAWAAYPHYRTRSKKMLCRAIFDKITTKGLDATIDGVRLAIHATPEDIIKGCKAAAVRVRQDDSDDSGQYVAGFQVWLRQGRMFDEDDELDALVERYDDIQERMAKRKLRIVK